MSAQPTTCETCHLEGVFARAGKFPEQGEEVTYGVRWQCPVCGEVSLDLCPLAAVEPEPGGCLNCGALVPEGEACPACAMTAPEALAFLHLTDPAERTHARAEDAFDAGLYRRGFAILDGLLQGDATDTELWRAKGTQYQILRLDASAARCYRRALALAPNPLLEIALACALSAQKDHEGARALYDELIETSQDPEVLGVAHANRGNLHEAADRVDAAIADFEAALGHEPTRLTHFQNYARLFSRRKRWAEALAVVLRGLEVASGDERVPLLVEQARACNELEQAEAGLAAADELLALAEDHPRGLFHRAWALGLMGRLDDAASTLERLLEVDPTSKDGAKALAKIEAARAKATRPWWKLWG